MLRATRMSNDTNCLTFDRIICYCILFSCFIFYIIFYYSSFNTSGNRAFGLALPSRFPYGPVPIVALVPVHWSQGARQDQSRFVGDLPSRFVLRTGDKGMREEATEVGPARTMHCPGSIYRPGLMEWPLVPVLVTDRD